MVRNLVLVVIQGRPLQVRPNKSRSWQVVTTGIKRILSLKPKASPRRPMPMSASRRKELMLAKLVEKVLYRVDVLEAEVQTLKFMLKVHEDGSKPLMVQPRYIPT